jgi:hypothetical protein
VVVITLVGQADFGDAGSRFSKKWTTNAARGANVPGFNLILKHSANAEENRPRHSKAVAVEQGSDLSWYFELITRSVSHDGFTRSDTRSMLSNILELVAKGNFSILSALLSNSKTFELNVTLLVALARSTYVVRTKITSWADFIENLRSALSERGIDSDSVLRGLC